MAHLAVLEAVSRKDTFVLTLARGYIYKLFGDMLFKAILYKLGINLSLQFQVFSFKEHYVKNKKKFDTIFKHTDLFVNHDEKPPKMEGLDTVDLDGE